MYDKRTLFCSVLLCSALPVFLSLSQQEHPAMNKGNEKEASQSKIEKLPARGVTPHSGKRHARRVVGGGAIILIWKGRTRGQTAEDAVIALKRSASVLLFRSRETGFYEDPGGGLEAAKDGTSALKTARRELKEESLGLFAIMGDTTTKNKHILTTNAPFPNYTNAIIVIKNKDPDALFDKLASAYRNNLGIVKRNVKSLPDHWFETDDIKRFHLSDFVPAVAAAGRLHNRDKNGIPVKSADGTQCLVRDRTFAVLHHLVTDPTSVLRSAVAAKIAPTNNTIAIMHKKCPHGVGMNGCDVEKSTRLKTSCVLL